MNKELLNDMQFLQTNYTSMSRDNILALKQADSPAPKSNIIFQSICVFILALIVFNIVGADKVPFLLLLILSYIFMLPAMYIGRNTGTKFYISFLITGIFVVLCAASIIELFFSNAYGKSSSILSYLFGVLPCYIPIGVVVGFKVFWEDAVKFSRHKDYQNAKKKSLTLKNTNEEHYYHLLKKYNLLEPCELSIFQEYDSDFWMHFLNAMDNQIVYPTYKNFNFQPSNKRDLLNKYLQKQTTDNLLRKHSGTDYDNLKSYLNILEPKFKIENHLHEKYLLFIKDFINSTPDFPCNISSLNRLSSPILVKEDDENQNTFPIELPNLASQIAPYNSAIQEITKAYNQFKSNWQRFNNDCKGTFIGEAGERSVVDELKFFSNQMKILTNIRLELNGQSVESDIVVVAPQGIFSLEVKNLGSTGSYNITVEKDGLWKKVMKNGRWKPMGSISKQNIRHLHGIEQVINTKFGNSLENWINAHSIIVFANDVVGIRNYSNISIVRASEIMGEIRKHPVCLNEDQIQKIANILQKESLPPKKYEMENWLEILVGLKLDIIERTEDLLRVLSPYFDILNQMVGDIPNYCSYPNYKISQDIFTVSLEDDGDEYNKSAEELAEEENRRKHSRQNYNSYQNYSDENEGNNKSYNDLLNEVYGMRGNPMDIMNPYNDYDKDMPWVDNNRK